LGWRGSGRDGLYGAGRSGLTGGRNRSHQGRGDEKKKCEMT